MRLSCLILTRRLPSGATGDVARLVGFLGEDEATPAEFARTLASWRADLSGEDFVGLSKLDLAGALPASEFSTGCVRRLAEGERASLRRFGGELLLVSGDPERPGQELVADALGAAREVEAFHLSERVRTEVTSRTRRPATLEALVSRIAPICGGRQDALREVGNLVRGGTLSAHWSGGRVLLAVDDASPEDLARAGRLADDAQGQARVNKKATARAPRWKEGALFAPGSGRGTGGRRPFLALVRVQGGTSRRVQGGIPRPGGPLRRHSRGPAGAAGDPEAREGQGLRARLGGGNPLRRAGLQALPLRTHRVRQAHPALAPLAGLPERPHGPLLARATHRGPLRPRRLLRRPARRGARGGGQSPHRHGAQGWRPATDRADRLPEPEAPSGPDPDGSYAKRGRDPLAAERRGEAVIATKTGKMLAPSLRPHQRERARRRVAAIARDAARRASGQEAKAEAAVGANLDANPVGGHAEELRALRDRALLEHLAALPVAERLELYLALYGPKEILVLKERAADPTGLLLAACVLKRTGRIEIEDGRMSAPALCAS